MKGMRRAVGAAVVAMLLRRVQGRVLDRLRDAGHQAQAAWQSTALPAQVAALRTRDIPGQLAALGAGGLTGQLSTMRPGALADPVASLRTSTVAASLGIKPRRDRRDIVTTALVAGTIAAAVTAAAFALAAVMRSRRRDARVSADASARRVAVPVVVPDGEQQDELRSIRGIGSVSAERLRGIGITTVAQIAAWRPEDVQRIAEQIELSPERIEREDWVGQARSISGAETATDLA